MKKQVDIFKPGLAELQKMATRLKGVKIVDTKDVEGYKNAKEAKTELAKMRIIITKFGKEQRKEARDYASEVIRQEKEHLALIVPVEDDIKKQIDAVDEEKRMEERKVLLPSRKKMLEGIETKMTDEEILLMDEQCFSEHFSQLRNDYLFEKERKLQEREAQLKREKELEEARKIAREEEIENAKIARIEEKKRADDELKRVEQEKKDEIERLKQEQIDKEAREKRDAEELIIRKENEAKRFAEEERVKKLEIEADKKYQKFLADNKYNEETDLLNQFKDEIFMYRLVNKFKK
ncbi:MAG: hypothetical protein PF542_06545 [Nanoarchaeota archaeon]|jgi:hypothetical protein|nr:hypothetical protein [Nanoarchaeota archaeon]